MPSIPPRRSLPLYGKELANAAPDGSATESVGAGAPRECVTTPERRPLAPAKGGACAGDDQHPTADLFKNASNQG
jgi:hypothetical protein